MKKIILVILLTALSKNGFCYPFSKTLRLTILNHTNTTFTFENLARKNPGNVFVLSDTEITPNGSIMLTGTIDTTHDLAGEFIFSNNISKINRLIVVDPRNFHITQPIFNLRNRDFHSKLKFMAYGDKTNPHELLVSEAIITIENS